MSRAIYLPLKARNAKSYGVDILRNELLEQRYNIPYILLNQKVLFSLNFLGSYF
jgi:hypothetical protein